MKIEINEKGLETVVAFARRAGVTPAFTVVTREDVTGEVGSNDERGARFVGGRTYFVRAEAGKWGAEFAVAATSLDATVNRRAVIEPYLRAAYEAVVLPGNTLPEEKEEAILLDGTIKGKAWQVVRVDGPDGYYIEFRKEGRATRLLRSMVYSSKYKPGRWFLAEPWQGKLLCFLSAEDAEMLRGEFDLPAAE